MTTLILLCVALQNSLSYKPNPGTEPISTALINLQDKKRNKDLPLKVTYPKGKGPYPVIVFSHGFRGSRNTYGPLCEHWASWGYVCIQPTHEDSLELQPLAVRLKPFDTDNGKAFSGWARRTEDISFIVDSLKEIESKVPGVHTDPKRLGMGGHSFGAGTSELIGGTQPRAGKAYADPRFSAILMISPQGRGGLYNQNAWKPFTRPGMVISGSEDTSIDGADAVTRKDPYLLSPPGDKYLLWIDGAHHGFGGITGRAPFPTSGPKSPEQVSWVQMGSLAFWDAYVKGDKAALEYLKSDGLAKVSKGKVELSRR